MVHLPAGYGSLTQLHDCMAGHDYCKVHNQCPYNFATTIVATYYFSKRAIAADSSQHTSNPDARIVTYTRDGNSYSTTEYVHVYEDGSVYVHSNADDEVWESFGDYLYERELSVDGWWIYPELDDYPELGAQEISGVTYYEV